MNATTTAPAFAATAPDHGWTLRPATRADMDAMVRLLGVLFGIEADFTPNVAAQRAGLALMLAAPATRCVLVAELDGAVVGMGTLQMVVSTAEGAPSGLIEDVVVDETARGLGIGRALVDGLRRRAAERGATRVQLLADADNGPALAFYEHIEFSRTGLVCLRAHLNSTPGVRTTAPSE
ncbi:MAG: GNAT family N-acetyltransferase [Desulfovibrionaceae bacterium]|jgi:ribosomal protein S18 acetylase RimI-like enzyme|nr:GNAT family N-acetyltransferase [Desulfovibrionaceae bacterium]